MAVAPTSFLYRTILLSRKDFPARKIVTLLIRITASGIIKSNGRNKTGPSRLFPFYNICTGQSGKHHDDAADAHP